MKDARLQPGNIVAERYQIERELGEGAMGAVFAVRDIESGERLALKCLRRDHREDPAIVTRFRREARATARLRSEHVARVYAQGELPGIGDDPPSPYLVMELLRGSDLRWHIELRGRLSMRRTSEYVRQACLGLAEAHALGIIHRDVKPGNLFVTRHADGTPLIKLLDFGIAKFESPNASGDRLEMTEYASSMGSLQYMAPEQILDARAVDARADVWGLGVVLYQCVTGEKPFNGEEITDVAYRVLTGPPTPVQALAPNVPEEFSRIIMRCLEKKRDRRFPNTVELARALAPFTRNRPSPSQEELAVRTTELEPVNAAWLLQGSRGVPPPPDSTSGVDSVGPVESTNTEDTEPPTRRAKSG